LLVPAIDTTTLAITSSLNPSQYGQLVTFTATLSTAGVCASATPTGSVTFNVGTNSFNQPLVGLKATYSTCSLPVGSNGVNAIYVGNLVSSSANLPTQTVNLATTQLVLTPEPNRASIIGELLFAQVNLVVDITGPGPCSLTPALNGSVTIYDYGNRVGSFTLPRNSIVLKFGLGVHQLRATYTGDADRTGSSGQANLTVNLL